MLHVQMKHDRKPYRLLEHVMSVTCTAAHFNDNIHKGFMWQGNGEGRLATEADKGKGAL